MSSISGVGFSQSTSSAEAIGEATEQALKSLGGRKPTFAFLFSTPKHDSEVLLKGLKAKAGTHVPIVGGPSIGVITQDHLSYAGYEVGVALVSSDTCDFRITNQTGLGQGGEFDVGTRIGQSLTSSHLGDARFMMLFYDSVRGSQQIPMNLATPILQGMGQHIKKWPPTAGIGFLGSNQFTPQKTWVGQNTSSQNVLAITGHGKVAMDIHVFHGCRPSSDYFEITKVDGPVILEIEGRPALDDIIQRLGGAIDPATLPLRLLLGVNEGDPYDEFDPAKYATRLCLAIDETRRGLVMFETDLAAGHRIQLMKRSSDMDYMRQEALAFLSKLQGKKPFLAIYADCLGRAAALCGDTEEEAAQVQNVFRDRIPLLGFYSGVEIAPINNKVRALDWTGVLCVLSET